MLLAYTLALANNETAAVAATGTITVGTAWASIAAADTLTLRDGVSAAKVFTFISGDGSNTTKDNIDIFGAGSADDIGQRIRAAIDLANAALEVQIDAFHNGASNVVNLLNTTAGAAGNVAMATTCAALELALVGMSGGANIVPASYAIFDLRNITGNPQAYLVSAELRISSDCRFATAAGQELTGQGDYVTIPSNNFGSSEPARLNFEGSQPQWRFYLNSSAATASLLVRWDIEKAS